MTADPYYSLAQATAIRDAADEVIAQCHLDAIKQGVARERWDSYRRLHDIACPARGLASTPAPLDVERLSAAIRKSRRSYIDIINSHNVWQDPNDEPMMFEPDEYDSLAIDIAAAYTAEETLSCPKCGEDGPLMCADCGYEQQSATLVLLVDAIRAAGIECWHTQTEVWLTADQAAALIEKAP
jgi:hypothetical protein